jgi:hypothetical protein
MSSISSALLWSLCFEGTGLTSKWTLAGDLIATSDAAGKAYRANMLS